MSLPIQTTSYGFEYGPAKVERMCSDDAKGWVVIGIESKKSRVQVYVTKTGKVRVYKDSKELV